MVEMRPPMKQPAERPIWSMIRPLVKVTMLHRLGARPMVSFSVSVRLNAACSALE